MTESQIAANVARIKRDFHANGEVNANDVSFLLELATPIVPTSRNS